MQIIHAELSDIDILVDFRKKQLIDEGQTPSSSIDAEIHKYYTQYISQGACIPVLAMDNGKPIAAGAITFRQNPPSYNNVTGRYAYIHSLYTEPANRGRGVATAIMDNLIGIAKLLGYTEVRLHSSVEGAIVYKKMEFDELSGYMLRKL